MTRRLTWNDTKKKPVTHCVYAWPENKREERPPKGDKKMKK